jgi:hemolysin III
MYLFSTLSHAIRSPEWRHLYRRLDQGFVYILIAGTFTPFICAFVRGGWMWGMLAFVWLSAGLGFYSKVLSRHRIDNMASLTYLLLGWVPSIMLLSCVPWACFGWMALGGVLYSVGVWFLQNDHRGFFHHALWHVIVIAASACHYLTIWHFAT